MNLSKLKYRLKQSLFFYCLLLVVGVYAQRYPVQVTQTIIPPYSTKLSDYATASDVKFRLNLLLTDVVANNKQVRLKLRIKGNGFDIQSTDFVTGASQVILNGGVLQQFTNIDLAAYFQPNNLIGISPQQYNKPLPEGMYSFCWEVYDAYTNQQLNHPTAGCSNVYLLLNDPPFLNLPYKGDQIVAQDPMNIIFQWTPRHTNATNVSYEFELRELWDTQVNPQAAFLASPNYYSETTYTTTLLYNIGKPTLLPNRRYGWRVKAKSTTGVSENSIFKNDGYSEIYYFTYTNACYPPTFVLSEVVAKDRVKLTWQGHPDHKKYHVQYKRADIPDAEWFEVYTYNTQAQISNLREGKTYMFRVGGTCNELTDFDQNYSYSHMSQFTMPAKDEMGSSYNCGIIPEIQIDNNDPLKNIGINETFTAGDFPVTVKQVQGGNGTFTGVGYIVVPYLADTKIAVTFDNISINTDYQLIEGVVKTTYDPTWGDMEDTNDWTQGGTGNSESTEVDFPVSDVQIDPNGDILVIGENGEVVELPGGEDIVITDSNGQVWAVDEEGNVTPQGTQAEGGASTPENTNGVNNNGQATAISAKGVIVTFKKASNSKYGFDSYESNYSATKDLYKKLGNNYYVPYKAVAKNDTETIVANLAITDSKIKPQDIVFKTKEGVAITKIDSTATSYTLQLKGIFDDAEIETQALVKQGTKYEVAGAFIQYQATPKNVKVVVVNTSNTNVRTIKESLQNIYKQAMVNLTITEINDFKNDLETLAPDGIIQSGESGFAAQYTEQQRQINNKLKQHSQYQQDAYYLIVTDKIPSSASEKGLMPLGRQFGYVYTTNCSTADCVALTTAHELGHGAFQLKHPFSSQSYQYAQKATNWLLDYKDGTKLPFVHWQTIHNPKLRIGVFDRDSEGQSTVVSSIPKEFVNSDKKTLTFMTLNGSYITLPKGVKELTFSTGLDNFDKFIEYPVGALIKFNINDVTFKAEVTRSSILSNIAKGDLTFTYKGFKSLGDGHFYGTKKEEKDYNKFEEGKVIALIPHYTTKYNDPYNLSGTIESGYQLIKIPRQDLSFSPKTGEQVTFNLLDDYTSISKFFSGYRSNPKPSKSYSYKEIPFNSQFELQAEYVNPILKDFSWTDKHAILAKYAVLNNAQPELFKSFFKQKYGEKSYTDIFKELNIDKLKETYIDLINSFSKERDSLIEELHNLLATVKVDTPSLVAVESVRINEILKQLTTEQIENYINPDQRETAIELLLSVNGETHYEKGKGVENKFDKQILKLVKFARKGDKQEVLISLTQKDYKLFWKSIEKLDEDIISEFLNLYTQYVNEKGSDIKYRTDILTELTDTKKDDWGNKTEKVFASIISNLENRSQDQADLVKYFESKPEVLKNAFNKLDNFVKVEELANFVFTICSWKVKLGDTSGINEEAFKEYAEVNYLAGTSYDAVKYIKPISQEHNYIPYFRESWIKSAQRGDNYYLDTKFTDNKINLELYRYGHEIISDSYSPLEYVYVHFREDSSYKTHQFKKGTGLKVPAIFIHWLDDSVDDDQNMAVARVVGNIIAIAAAPSTFGASLAPFVVNVEVAANLIDIYVTVNRQELIDTGLQEELAYWDAAFAIYSLKDLPDAIVGLGMAGKGFINTIDNFAGAIQQNRTILKSENLNNAVDAFHAIESTAKKEEVIKVLDEMLYVLKYKNPQKLDPVSKLINYRTYFKFRTKLATEFKKGAPTIIDIEASGVDFKPSLVYTNGSSKVNLGTLEFNSSNVLVLSDSKRLLPSGITNTEELATIKNVLVETTVGSKGVKNISVVKNLDDGEVYITLAGTPGVDVSEYKVPELEEIMRKLNPEGLTKNCFTVALKYQHETQKGIEVVIEEIAKKYRNGVSSYDVSKHIKEVFGEGNVREYPVSNSYEKLIETLQKIQQKRVILNAGLKSSASISGLNYHVINGRKLGDKWELVDLQNGTRYDQEFVDRVFSRVKVYEIKYPDYTYPSRNKLKQELSTEVHKWIDEIPNDFLSIIEKLPDTELKKFVNDFENDYTKLSEFNKESILFRVWKAFDEKDIPLKNNIEALKKAKPVICKY
jgi:hypothetical protein